MKSCFYHVVIAVMLSAVGFADGDAVREDFRKALSEPSIVACGRAMVPLFDKAISDGFFTVEANRNCILPMVADNVLDRRICYGDAMATQSFMWMEYIMRQIASCDTASQTNLIFTKLANYLSEEKPICTGNKEEEIAAARKKDDALILAGTIQQSPIVTAYPRTPNLLALKKKYDNIERWNSAVRKHRRVVGMIFSSRINAYIQTLHDDDRMKFRECFAKKAALSEEEKRIFFPVDKSAAVTCSSRSGGGDKHADTVR